MRPVTSGISRISVRLLQLGAHGYEYDPTSSNSCLGSSSCSCGSLNSSSDEGSSMWSIIDEMLSEPIEIEFDQRMDAQASCSDNMEIVKKPNYCSLTKKKEYPQIALPDYSWVDDGVGTFYFGYSDKLSIIYFINCVNVCTFMDEEFIIIHL